MKRNLCAEAVAFLRIRTGEVLDAIPSGSRSRHPVVLFGMDSRTSSRGTTQSETMRVTERTSQRGPGSIRYVSSIWPVKLSGGNAPEARRLSLVSFLDGQRKHPNSLLQPESSCWPRRLYVFPPGVIDSFYKLARLRIGKSPPYSIIEAPVVGRLPREAADAGQKNIEVIRFFCCQIYQDVP